MYILYSRIYEMFKQLKRKDKENEEQNKTFVEKICCRCYSDPIVDPSTFNIQNNKGNKVISMCCL